MPRTLTIKAVTRTALDDPDNQAEADRLRRRMWATADEAEADSTVVLLAAAGVITDLLAESAARGGLAVHRMTGIAARELLADVLADAGPAPGQRRRAEER